MKECMRDEETKKRGNCVFEYKITAWKKLKSDNNGFLNDDCTLFLTKSNYGTFSLPVIELKSTQFNVVAILQFQTQILRR